MGMQINTIDFRHAFVKGWLSVENGGSGDPGDGSVECGDGTEYPMEVTKSQLEEIFYRVRDAWFTSGTVETDVEVWDEAEEEWVMKHVVLQFGGTPPETQATDAIVRAYRDAESESDMWGEEFSIPPIDQTDLGVGSGFSHSIADDYGDLEEYPVTATVDGEPTETTVSRLRVVFNGRVAWIDGDHPLSPDSRLFVGVKIYDAAIFLSVSESLFGFPDYGYNFGTEKFMIGVPYGNNLVLEMASGSASCPLYSYSGGAPPVATDFVLSAKKWWPYAKSDGTPAWNVDTGASM